MEPEGKANVSSSVKLLQNLFLFLFSNLMRAFFVARTKMDRDWMRSICKSLYQVAAVSHQVLERTVVDEARKNWLRFYYARRGCIVAAREGKERFWFG